MELLLTLPTVVAAILGTVIFLSSLLLMSKTLPRNASNKKRAAPQAGGAWPVIGHLHLLGGPEPPHRVLGKMADKYGPIFSIKMGVHQTLVVNNSEIAKDCLTTNDKVFANRPKTIATEILGYSYFAMFGLSPYGHYWRQARKLATVELLSNHQLEKLKHVREAEIETSIKELYQVWVNNKSSSSTDGSNKVLVDMRRWFGGVTLNVILRMVAGKRCESVQKGEESEEYWKEELIRRVFELSGKFMLSDALPFLRWLDIGGDERLMKKTAKELNVVVQEWLDEHKRKRESGAVQKEDFMDVMLAIEDIPEEFSDIGYETVIKSICLALVLAGTDTTMVTLMWALSLLLNNQDVLKKAQDELDIHIGKQRQVNASDVENLVYLKAILKETMRLYPAGPLSIPHESLEDSIVNDYHIPARTRLLINLWKIHRDPLVWTNPCEFRPERFLTAHKDFDVRGQNFEFIPFGSGRRMCPGVLLAFQVLHLTLASLLHGFDLKTPFNEPVDMSEGLGLTILKTTPLNVLLTPRLPVLLYN